VKLATGADIQAGQEIEVRYSDGTKPIIDLDVNLGFSADSACVVTEDGLVACWGDNSAGVLGPDVPVGEGRSDDEYVYVGGFGGPVRAQSVSLYGRVGDGNGGAGACAVLTNDDVICWGGNDPPTPGPVGFPGGVAEVDGRCARLHNGDVWCRDGLIVGNEWVPSDVPVYVPYLSPALDISQHAYRTMDERDESIACAVLADRRAVRCAGYSSSWTIGSAVEDEFLHNNLKVEFPNGAELQGALTVETEQYGGCALTVAGATCWGNSTEGDILTFEGMQFDQTKPIPATAGATELAASPKARCAVMSDGTIRCWLSPGGLLGDSRSPASDSPSTVAGVTEARHLALGYDNLCATYEDDSLHCWGVRLPAEANNNETDIEPRRIRIQPPP
jgi:hypothetical protein